MRRRSRSRRCRAGGRSPLIVAGWLGAALVAAGLLGAAPAGAQGAAPGAPHAAAAAVAAAARAVESGRGDAERAALRARLAAAPGDRLAALGLATVARLTYDYRLADALLDELARPADAADGVGALALLGSAQARAARGYLGEADSAYARAASAARAAALPEAVAEALLGRAGARGRTQGVPAALATLDSTDAAVAAAAPRLAPDALARLRALAACGRAANLARSGGAGAAALIDSGIAEARRASPRIVGACRFARAQLHAGAGRMNDAAEELDSAAVALARAGDRATLAAVHQWRGYALLSVGSLEPARKHLALALAEGTASEALQPTAWALMNVGQSAWAMGDAAGAAAYYDRAETILARLGDLRGVASARGFRAGLAIEAGDAEGARALHAANARWAAEADDWTLLAEALRGLATVALLRHDWDGARSLLDSSAALTLRRGGARWAPSVAWDRGILALYRGDGARAEAELRRALAGFVSSQGWQRASLLAAIGEARLRQGDTAGAEALVRESGDVLDRWRATLGDDRLRALAFQLRDHLRDDSSVEVVIAALGASGRAAAAFDLAERRRARMLRDALARGDAGGPRPTSAPAIDATALGAALPDARTALALVVAGPSETPGTLLLVSRAGVTAHRLPPDDSLGAMVNRLRARVEDGADASAAARALGEALFGPGGAWLPRGVARLVVVPDGALHRASLALLDVDGHGPLGERVALSIAPSATVAALLWSRPRAPERAARVLAFGDPALGDAAVPAPDAEGAPLARLPRSADEARAAARVAPGSRVLLGAEASEAALRSPSVREYGVVHLATHAVVDDARPWATLIALAPGGGHDGFVRAGELASLPLAAGLVVLSACETAGGPVVGGEGVQGFAAALLASGVRAVVATRWALGDGEAALMMAAFYRALGDGLPADEALRRARAELRASGAPARTWAAFTLVGDGTVRVAPVRRSWMARVMGRR